MVVLPKGPIGPSPARPRSIRPRGRALALPPFRTPAVRKFPLIVTLPAAVPLAAGVSEPVALGKPCALSTALAPAAGPFVLSKVVSRRKEPAQGPVAEVVACTSKRPSLVSTAWTL